MKTRKLAHGLAGSLLILGSLIVAACGSDDEGAPTGGLIGADASTAGNSGTANGGAGNGGAANGGAANGGANNGGDAGSGAGAANEAGSGGAALVDGGGNVPLDGGAMGPGDAGPGPVITSCDGGSCSCADDCNLLCQAATCDLQCGANCDVTCDGTAGCTAAVGPGSTGSCPGDGLCEFTCEGDCTFNCGGGAECVVHCAVDTECRLNGCPSQVDCGDGVLACRTACPSATAEAGVVDAGDGG